MNRLGMIGGALLVVAACASGNKEITKIDDSGLGRLNEHQMEPVDDARVEQGRAQDALAKARAAEAEARSRYEVAKSERDVADAQLKRSQAERDMLKKQYADRDAMARAENDINGAQERIKATDLKLDYLKKMIEVASTERTLAEAHADTAAAITEQSKYRAMRAANAPQTQNINAAAIDSRVADAQLKEAQLRRNAADQRTAAVDTYNRWQELESKSKSMARPENLPTPPPRASEPSK
jgi:hypothetical protein